MSAQSTESPALSDALLANREALYSSVLRIVGCHHWAEDIVQDAYIKIAETNPAEDIRQPVSYLFRMVRNLAIDKSRRLALEGRYSADEEDAAQVYSPVPGPEQVTLDFNVMQRVTAALNELPDRTRTAFEMYRSGDYTQQKIAKTLGVSPTLVNFLIRDALTHCRSRLRQESELVATRVKRQ